jgi:hypothetical protein
MVEGGRRYGLHQYRHDGWGTYFSEAKGWRFRFGILIVVIGRIRTENFSLHVQRNTSVGWLR